MDAPALALAVATAGEPACAPAIRAGARGLLPFVVSSSQGPLTIRLARDQEGPPGSLVAELHAGSEEAQLLATERGPYKASPWNNEDRRTVRIPDELWEWAAQRGRPSSVVREALRFYRAHLDGGGQINGKTRRRRMEQEQG